MNANTPILTWLKNRPFGLKQRVRTWAWPRVRWKQWQLYAPDTIAFLRFGQISLDSAEQPEPENAELLAEFDGVKLWYLPDAPPFAFSAQPGLLQSPATLTKEDVSPLGARYAGTNQVVVRGEPVRADNQLVVLLYILLIESPFWPRNYTLNKV